MRGLLTLGVIAGGAYLGWQWFANRARSTVVDYVVGATDTMRAWNLYVASESYRQSPESMRLTRPNFIRIWEGLPADVRAHVIRAFTMTQAEVVQEGLRNPAFGRALAQASTLWRQQTGGGTSGFGNYVAG